MAVYKVCDFIVNSDSIIILTKIAKLNLICNVVLYWIINMHVYNFNEDITTHPRSRCYLLSLCLQNEGI